MFESPKGGIKMENSMIWPDKAIADMSQTELISEYDMLQQELEKTDIPARDALEKEESGVHDNDIAHDIAVGISGHETSGQAQDTIAAKFAQLGALRAEIDRRGLGKESLGYDIPTMEDREKNPNHASLTDLSEEVEK
jgi:hypothetical protein